MDNESTCQKPTRPVVLLIAAIALGILGEYLFYPGLLGVNAVVWTAALCAGAIGCARLTATDLRGEGRWLTPPALLFAGFIAWRSSPVLQALNIGAVIGILAIASFRLRDGKVRLGGVTEYILTGAVSLASIAVQAAELVFRRISWAALPGHHGKRVTPWIRGAAIALPLLVIFGALLSSADAVFSNAVTAVPALDISNVPAHIARALFWGWLAAGFIHGSLHSTGEQLRGPSAPPAIRLGPIEVSTILGLLDAMFLLFVVIQLRYLFGGSGHVQITEGLTYAEYARHGFFELLAVAALVLPVVLGVHWLLRDSSPAVRIAFRVLAAAMIVLIFAIVASALRRMDAYVDEFGLTQLRLYSTAVMLWLVAVFAWLAVTVLREQRQRFASGALAAGLLGIAGLNVVNPDAFIVSTNLERQGDRQFDASYALRLSPDATPTIAAAMASLPAATQCELAAGLASGPDTGPWQTWNLGRSRAASAGATLAQQEADCR